MPDYGVGPYGVGPYGPDVVQPRVRVGLITARVSTAGPQVRVGKITARVTPAATASSQPQVRVGTITARVTPAVAPQVRVGQITARVTPVSSGSGQASVGGVWVSALRKASKAGAWAAATVQSSVGGVWSIISAPGGGGGTGGGGTTPPVTNFTPWLPFELSPSMLAAMKVVPRKVYPVGVITFGPNTTNASQLPPGGSSQNPANGGTLRDYYPVMDSGGDLTKARVAELTDYKNAGLDAYIMDYFASSYGTQMTALSNAARATGTKIILQPDGSTSATWGRTTGPTIDPVGSYGTTGAQQCATIAINFMKGFADVHDKAPDGTFLNSPYNPEHNGKDRAWWQAFKDAMAAGGFPISIIGCMQDAPSNIGNYPWYGAGVWGDPIPDTLTNGSQTHSGWGSFVRSKGQKPYQWVRFQDDRPRNNLSGDPNGFDLLIKSFALAENSDGVFIPTTNDFTEGAQIARTVGNGYGILDVVSYYTAVYKLGAAAVPIVRDGLYVMHRKQTAAYKGNQPTAFGTWRNTPKDQVSCLCFATAPMQVTVAGVTSAVPAGVTQLHVPLKTGVITASASRNGSTVATVTSPHIVADTGVSNKLSYVTSSFPGRAGTALTF